MKLTAEQYFEIINNNRGGIKNKIWEAAIVGQIQVPDVHLSTMSQTKVVLDEFFFAFLNVFPRKNIENIIPDCTKQ